MNIDDLKEAWSQDEHQDIQLPVSAAIFGKTTSAVGRIRKNMRNEFIGCLISYTALVALLFSSVRSPLSFNVLAVFIFTVLVLNGFYFFRFYVLYKSIGGYNFNIRNSISKIAYELELNLEIYKTYNFCITPLAVLVLFILLCGENGYKFISHIFSVDAFTFPGNLLKVFFIILISFRITYLFINMHIRGQYGKYISELKQVVDDLGE